MKVFLGGTCNNSTWRDELMPMLDAVNIKYFNPIVEDWTEECYQEELCQREICDIVLYVITPEMIGVYSIAEVVDDSNKQPEKVIFCVYDKNNEFDKGQMKSLNDVSKMIESNYGTSLNFNDIAEYLETL